MHRNLTLSAAFSSLLVSSLYLLGSYYSHNSAFEITIDGSNYFFAYDDVYLFLGILFGIESIMFFSTRKMIFNHKKWFLSIYLILLGSCWLFASSFNRLGHAVYFIGSNINVEAFKFQGILLLSLTAISFIIGRAIMLKYFIIWWKRGLPFN